MSSKGLMRAITIIGILLVFGLSSCEYDKSSPPFQTQGSDGYIEIPGVNEGDPNEVIYVHKAGHGPHVVVMLSGSNTSGVALNPVKQRISGIDYFNDNFTYYIFDIRGTGKSSYNTKITSLKDCAVDIEKAMSRLEDFPKSGITLAGWSGGFGVAMELMLLNPDRYSRLISLAGISTRGHRFTFSNDLYMPDWYDYDGDGDTTEYVFLFKGNAVPGQYEAGDWVPVQDDAAGIEAMVLQQRNFLGENHTYDKIQDTWNMSVFNDHLKYDIYNHQVTDSDNALLADPNYKDFLVDSLHVQNNPEFYFYQQKFNISNVDLSHINSDGTEVSIPGDNRLASLPEGKEVLFLKAKQYILDPATYYFHLRGDILIPDSSTTDSHNDFKSAGAAVTTILIEPDYGYDHGFPATHSLEMIKVIDSFINGDLTVASAESILGCPVSFYDTSVDF